MDPPSSMPRRRIYSVTGRFAPKLVKYNYFRRSQTEKNISLTRVVRVKKKSNMKNRLSC